MKLGWGPVRDGALALARRAGQAGGIALLALAGAGLAAGAADSAKEGTELARRSRALDGELRRARASNEALRREIRALESDPVYLESLLRGWRRAGAGERVVE
jgi:endonuclease/exonuclease/phosphatase (EEP) superfamily protein YafD